ncbi:sulfotransferase domain-containing protein [Desulfobacter latus]|uniref:Sulfotransferase domain-containing protein n=1 Tax=Desulfobacter latus TaxID=2292 RepID=A0A850SWF7_9BACT|nr:sulfotransferase domain-containing protein [Desulfobacter latus]NWH05664.1 sulfotransferase domain-containing protein [Desulfobacter latus]
MDYYIHVGFPKTATTTLQDNVFLNHSGIRYLGKSVLFKNNKEKKIYQRAGLFMNLWRQPKKDWNENDAKQIVQNCILPDCSDEKPNVVSLEELSYATPRRWAVPRRIWQVFGDAKIILTIRSQYDSLVSAYYWKFLNLELNDRFDKWFDKMMACSGEKLNQTNQPLNLPKYYDVVKAYEKVFGRENICILPFEWLIKEPEKFSIHLSNFVGIDSEETSRLLAWKKQNIRQSKSTIEYQRIVKKAYLNFFKIVNEELPMAKAAYYNGVYSSGFHGVVSNVMNKFSAPPRKSLAPLQSSFILEYYGEGNAKLMEEYDLDLKAYGYPCA